MSPLGKLFKQTFIYGLATVLPRVLSFLLLPLYTDILDTAGYGEVSIIFAWFAIFNVLLAYGMETAFFRFYHGKDDKSRVLSTSLLSVLGSTLVFVVLALLLQGPASTFLVISPDYILYTILILALDALVVIPFAWLRANERPMRYAVIKLLNVAVNFGLNIFFLLVLPGWAEGNPDGWWAGLYVPNFEISYIFISNLIASGLTLMLMAPLYWKTALVFDKVVWKKLIRYGVPVMLAGVAFTVNEVLDRPLLARLLPQDIAESEVGKYAACYKLAVFMTLFATAFRLGIEPFFFSHFSSEKKPQRMYAQITNYFVILGSVILLGVVVFSDLLKVLFIRNPEYWDAMDIVPIILLASFFLGIYHSLSVWYKVTDQTKYGAYISAIGALITIIINFALIPYWGYMASAVATLAAYTTMMLLSFYFGAKSYPIPYNFRKIVFYIGLSILFSVIAFYGFDGNIWVGSIFLFVYLWLVYRLENDKLRAILQRPKQ